MFSERPIGWVFLRLGRRFVFATPGDKPVTTGEPSILSVRHPPVALAMVMTDLLDELLIYMYSDEGTPIGAVCTALWPVLAAELQAWLVRDN